MAECACPSWWDCVLRGCYEDAKARYADASIERDLARGFPNLRPYEFEYDSAGNVITYRLPQKKG